MEGGEISFQEVLEQENARKRQALELTKVLFSEDDTRARIEEGIRLYGRQEKVQIEMSAVGKFLKDNSEDQIDSPKPGDGAVYSVWSMLTAELKNNPQLIEDLKDEEKARQWNQELANKVNVHYSTMGAGSA